MKSKKSQFWRFWFSFIPGAAEMYMGFMKMGLSIMIGFISIITVASILEIGMVMMFAMVVWCYGFFHAHNLASIPDDKFAEIEDEYLFNFDKLFANNKDMVKNYRKTIAIILIIIGAFICYNFASDLIYQVIPSEFNYLYNRIAYRIPQFAVGVGIVVLGIYMIKGKKKEIDNNGNGTEDDKNA